jgi:hypothetical protein
MAIAQQGMQFSIEPEILAFDLGARWPRPRLVSRRRTGFPQRFVEWKFL